MCSCLGRFWEASSPVAAGWNADSRPSLCVRPTKTRLSPPSGSSYRRPNRHRQPWTESVCRPSHLAVAYVTARILTTKQAQNRAWLKHLLASASNSLYCLQTRRLWVFAPLSSDEPKLAPSIIGKARASLVRPRSARTSKDSLSCDDWVSRRGCLPAALYKTRN
jgi:hypothetical protein